MLTVIDSLFVLCDIFSIYVLFFFFFKQKTAYDMRISDWSSDVCSSDLRVTTWLPEMQSEQFLRSAIGRGERTAECWAVLKSNKIGRASCRERVCQYV